MCLAELWQVKVRSPTREERCECPMHAERKSELERRLLQAVGLNRKVVVVGSSIPLRHPAADMNA